MGLSAFMTTSPVAEESVCAVPGEDGFLLAPFFPCLVEFPDVTFL